MKRSSVVYLTTRIKKDFENQKTHVEQFCKYKFSIKRIFHDHRMNAKAPANREAYCEMLSYCNENDIKNIIMYDIALFASNPDEALKELKNLSDSGFTVTWASRDFIGYRNDSEERRQAVLDFLSYMDLYRDTQKSGPKAAKTGQRRPGRPKALDEGKREALIAIRRGGTSIGQICRMFNVSRSTVSKILADYPELKGEWKGKTTRRKEKNPD